MKRTPKTDGMTRADYMENRITFAEYYGNVAALAGIDWSNHEMLPKVKAALAAGDEHLNSIPLQSWDAWGFSCRPAIARALKQVNNTGGVSQSDLVCTLKQAARDAATE